MRRPWSGRRLAVVLGNATWPRLRVGQFDQKGYDLRRGKTGVERYGETPPLVWKAMQAYLKETPRRKGDRLFVTTEEEWRLCTASTDSVTQWWRQLA